MSDTESVITQEMKDAIGVESDPVVYQIEKGAECLLCPFQSLQELPSILDSKIADLDSSVISLIPAGAFPRKAAREQLIHFSRSEYQFWGWYHFGNKFFWVLTWTKII